MNANAPRLTTRETTPACSNARRSSRRARGPGTGYGRSSGYADGLRRYVERDATTNFRVH